MEIVDIIVMEIVQREDQPTALVVVALPVDVNTIDMIVVAVMGVVALHIQEKCKHVAPLTVAAPQRFLGEVEIVHPVYRQLIMAILGMSVTLMHMREALLLNVMMEIGVSIREIAT